jgi:cell shape-determining protein MreC
MSKLDRELLQLFRKVRDRIHSNIILDYSVKAMAAGLGLSLLAALLARFVPIYAVYTKGALGVLTAVLLGVLYGAFRTPSSRRTALKVDGLGLQERTLTAVDLIGEQSTFAILEKEDALRHLKGINLKKSFPIRPSKKYLAICMLLVSVLLFSAFIPNPMAEKARELNKLNQEISKQQKKTAELVKKINKNAKLTEEQKKEAEVKLQELKKELAAAKSQKDIEKALQKTEKKLEYLSNKYTDSKDNLEKLANILAKNQATKQLADMIKNANEKQLQESIKQTAEALKKMDKEQLRELSKQLSDLAEQVKTNPELKQALADLAQKLANGELGDMSEALGQLSDSISDLMSDANMRDAMQELAKQLGDMQQGQQDGNQSGQGNQGNGQQDGNGQLSGGNQGNGSNGATQGQGQGNSNTPGQGQGGGAGNGTDMGQENPTPITPSGGIQKKDGSTKKMGEYEKIFTSKTLGGDGEQSNLKGQKTNGGSTDQIKTDKSQTIRGTSVPYNQVIGQYRQEALDSMNSTDIPAGLQDLVKDYFSSLEE